MKLRIAVAALAAVALAVAVQPAAARTTAGLTLSSTPPPFNATYDSTDAVLPPAACPSWERVGDGTPTLAADGLRLATSGSNLFFRHAGAAIALPERLVIEARLRVDAVTTNTDEREPAVVAFTTAPSVGNVLFVGSGRVFLLAADLSRGPTANVATTGGFHTYRIEVATTTGAVDVFYDGTHLLSGSTFASDLANGNERRVLWGDSSSYADGTSTWQLVRHNAHASGCTMAPDTTPPAIAIKRPGDGATYLVGETVSVRYSCDDGAGSGVAACAGSTANGALLPTSLAGERTFGVEARDRSGNTASQTVAYTVAAVPAADPPTVTVPEAVTVDATDARGAVVAYEATAAGDRRQVIVGDSTLGYHNAGLGTVLDGTQPQFPRADVRDGDPVIRPAAEPDLAAAAAALGGWLSPAPIPLAGAWTGPAAVPPFWTTNAETAVLYPLDGGGAGLRDVRAVLGADNGVFVWVNGDYRFGAVEPGSYWAEYDVRLGNLPPGTSYLQLLREDHGGATGWHISVSALVRAPLTPACSPASGSVFPVGTTTVTCTATDATGRIARATFDVTVRQTDATPPAVELRTPVDGAVYHAGDRVVADYACADEGGSGVASCTGTVASGAAIDTAGGGVRTFAVTATDGAGNTTTRSVSYRVNARPEARFTAAPQPAEVGRAVAFDGTASSDAEGAVASYAWSFGDGAAAAGTTASRTYAAAGTYRVTLTVTDGDGATGSQELTVTVRPPLPDLVPNYARFLHANRSVLESHDHDTTLAAAGQNLWVHGRGINAGRATASGTSRNQFYLSRDASLDASDVLLAQHDLALRQGNGALDVPPGYFVYVADWAGDRWAAWPLAATIPAGLEPGRYYVLTRLDALDAIAESDERNNVAVTEVEIGLPDLVVYDWPFGSDGFVATDARTAPLVTSIGPNQPLFVSSHVWNRGRFPAAGPWQARYYLSRDAILDAGDALALAYDYDRGHLPIFASGIETIDAPGPKLPPVRVPATLEAGQYHLILQVDATNRLAETDETNNVRALGTVTVVLPNLAVSLPAMIGSVVAGGSVSVSWETRNDGPGAAYGPWTDDVYVSPVPYLSGMAAPVGSVEIAGPVAPGGEVRSRVRVTAPADAGRWYVLVVTNGAGGPAETTRADNEAARRLQVRERPRGRQ